MIRDQAWGAAPAWLSQMRVHEIVHLPFELLEVIPREEVLEGFVLQRIRDIGQGIIGNEFWCLWDQRIMSCDSFEIVLKERHLMRKLSWNVSSVWIQWVSCEVYLKVKLEFFRTNLGHLTVRTLNKEASNFPYARESFSITIIKRLASQHSNAYLVEQLLDSFRVLHPSQPLARCLPSWPPLGLYWLKINSLTCIAPYVFSIPSITRYSYTSSLTSVFAATCSPWLRLGFYCAPW